MPNFMVLGVDMCLKRKLFHAVRRISCKKSLTDSIMAFMVAFFIMLMLYKIYGYAPFGNNSLAVMDANIQYLDFFAYLKDVLEGQNSVFQTFSSLLGGNNIGTYGYYLASPFNFFVIFFRKEELHAFFNLLAALKIAASAATFSIFFHGRFRDFLKDRVQGRIFCVLLSLGYALGQYNIAQSSNIMWLDGVYMLPLILLGVYSVVRDSSGWRLSLSVGLSIAFCWYTGGINCLFSALWVWFEIAWATCSEDGRFASGGVLRSSVRCLIHYGVSMVVGILLSAAIFLPVVLAMGDSSKGALDLGLVKDTSFIGKLPSVIQGYTFGAKSSYGNVSLFCGSLAVVGSIGCFVTKKISIGKKRILGIALGVVLLLFYWKPFYLAFSLFKSVGSYWYRYSYIGIFVLLFLASVYYLAEAVDESEPTEESVELGTGGEQKGSKGKRHGIWKAGFLFAGGLIILDYLKASQNLKNTYYTAISVMLLSGILSAALPARVQGAWHHREGKEENAAHKKVQLSMAVCTYGLLSICAIFELAYGAKLQMYNYHVSDVQEYKTYVQGTEGLLDIIRSADGLDIYRISQTSTRNHNRELNRTANYNESLAFGYASIAGYTSALEERQLNLLDKLGYREEGSCISVVNTSILGADSFLGVKYVLSEYPINGLVEREGNVEADGRRIFVNPYCLPFAFSYDGFYDVDLEEGNPFLYQNALYSQLLGQKTELYVPLGFSASQDGEGAVRYRIQIPSGNYAVYGNITWDKEMDAVINVNGTYRTLYSKWLSPSVFYIPTNEEEETAWLELTASDYNGIRSGEEQFYALDLDTLGEATGALCNREADVIDVRNGAARFEIEAKAGTYLYISIPYNSGWTVTNNGKETEYTLFADCMYSVVLEDGKNVIEMTYHLPGLRAGIASSCLGVLLTVGISVGHRMGNRKTKIKNKMS